MGRAVQHDPLNATWHAIWGAHLFDAKRFDQAIAEGLRATELEPNYFIAQHLLGEAYWASGKWNLAIAAFERAYQLAPWTITAGWLAAALWQRARRHVPGNSSRRWTIRLYKISGVGWSTTC